MIAEQYSLFEPPKAQKLSQASRTLAMLKVADCNTRDLHVIGTRPAAYVRELRKMGYVIEASIVDGIALYSLQGKVPQIEVTEEMKLAYWASPHWRAKSLERKQFDRFTCACCRVARRLQVHHWRYDLFAEQLCDLLTVCRDCHKRLHSYPNVHCHFPHYVSPEIAEQLT